MARARSLRTPALDPRTPVPDLICLSHLRWDFVFQRPQHLMTRFGRRYRVFFVEEPIFDGGPARLEVSARDGNIWVVTPHLPALAPGEDALDSQQQLLDQILDNYRIYRYILWYYTPLAMPFTRHLRPLLRVYDCMDELSLFRGAPGQMRKREAELLSYADLVFTGGMSLYEAKKEQHPDVHPFLSSVDHEHYLKARSLGEDPVDQAGIPHPRLGFFGVIDERMDLDLLREVAEARPGWQLVLCGPVVKIDPAELPRLPNIHYLGQKSYKDLPAYLAGWDVTLLPFAMNEATRFISPTKTLEYLAGGKPVVSTPVHDVVHPYGALNLVSIAETPAQFVQAVEQTLAQKDERAEWLERVDEFLSHTSWNQTWRQMVDLMETAMAHKRRSATVLEPATLFESMRGAMMS